MAARPPALPLRAIAHTPWPGRLAVVKPTSYLLDHLGTWTRYVPAKNVSDALLALADHEGARLAIRKPEETEGRCATVQRTLRDDSVVVRIDGMVGESTVDPTPNGGWQPDDPLTKKGVLGIGVAHGRYDRWSKEHYWLEIDMGMVPVVGKTKLSGIADGSKLGSLARKTREAFKTSGTHPNIIVCLMTLCGL